MTTPDFFRLTADGANAAAPALPGKLTRLLASHDVKLPAGKVTVQALDRLLAGTSMSPSDRISVKTILHARGLLLDR